MKKTINILTSLATIIVLSSFAHYNTEVFIGTFGVSENDPSQIKLVINSDHTFYYQDFSVPDNKIVANGKWTSNGKKVRLQSNGSETKFHKVWTFAKDGQVARSRKGLCFYRLHKISFN